MDGPSQTDTFNLINWGTRENWSGNDTLSVGVDAPSVGGLNNSGGNVLNEGAAQGLAGSVSRALYWNDLGTVMPEPSSYALLGLACLLGVAFHRRSRTSAK